MAKTGVTFEQVALACQSLLKEGQSPNFRTVLAKTGGAAAKVSEHLNTWRNEQEAIVLAALDEELSPQIKQAILAESARKTTLVKQQLSGKITAMEQQLAEMGKLLLKTDLEKDQLTQEKLYRESALAHERAHTEKLMIQKHNENLEKRVERL
jgi:hypothetical protein